MKQPKERGEHVGSAGGRLGGCRASCGGCPHLWPEHRQGNFTEVSPEQLQETCPQHGSSGLPLEHPHGVRGTSSETRGPRGDTSPCACLRQNEHKRGESPQTPARHKAPGGSCCSQQPGEVAGHGPRLLRVGRGCDTSKAKSRSSHFAPGTKPRQGAAPSVG